MSDLVDDVRYALRILRGNYIFAAAAILALALGIGANTAIFSMVNGVLLRELPFKDPGRLVWIWGTRTDRKIKAFFSIPDFLDTREASTTLGELAAVRPWGANLTAAGEPERLLGVRVTGNAFETLGVPAALGRVIQPSDDSTGSQRVIVLTTGLWKRRFGSSPELIGKNIVLNGDSYTVVGILPPDFIFPGQLDAEMAIPIRLDEDPNRGDRGANILRLFGRSKDGVTIPQVHADLESITRTLHDRYPDTNAKYGPPDVVSMQAEISGGYQTALLMLQAAVALVLLISCSNLANLLLARAMARKKEFALRIALGASGRRLVRQVLTESMVLAFLGGLLGVILAWRGINLLVAMSPSNLPRSNEIGIDWKVLAFTLVISLAAGLVFGIAPAMQARKVDMNEEIKGGVRGLSDIGRWKHARGLLVCCEVAISLMLLVGAGLLLKSLEKLQTVSAGFEPKNLLLATVSFPQTKYSTSDNIRQFYESLLPQLTTLPGVKSVSSVNAPPLSALNNTTEFTIVGFPPKSPTDIPVAQNCWVGPGYFGTMEIPVDRGREFTDHDTATSKRVVVIDKALAARFFHGMDPLGMHMMIGYAGAPDPQDAEIVGIAGNVKHFSLEEDPLPTVYAPFYQTPKGAVPLAISNRMSLLLRTSFESMNLATSVRQAIQATDSDIPTTSIRTMDQMLDTSTAPRRFNTLLLTIFSVSALLLAALGVYAVVSYLIAQSVIEIGIRMSLGAQPGDILKLMTGKGIRPVLAGLVIGLIGAIAAARAISSMLFQISALDPSVFVAVPIALFVVSMLAVYIPARRAIRVDPVVALRQGQ